MRKQGKRLILLLALTLLLAACAGGEEKEETGLLLYYPVAELSAAAGADAVVTREAAIDGAENMATDELARRLVEELLGAAPDTLVRQIAPSGTTLQSLTVRGSWAYVDLSRQYARLAGIDLTIADYCVALTLTQLDGVNAVSITSGGRELSYRPAQALTGADPLLSLREDALRPITVSLYFCEKGGDTLRAERQALMLYEGQTRVNALLEALMQGPESDELEALLPETFTVLSSRVEEGICYLNLPPDAVLGDRPALALHALAASICSLDKVEAVQIVVDGEIVQSLHGVDVSGVLTP